jgi:hypothetical protein
VGHISHMGKRDVRKFLVGKLKGDDRLGGLVLGVRITLKLLYE